MIPFQEACDLLDRLGASYTRQYEYRGKHPDRERFEFDKFTHVDIPLTAVQWIELCRREGNYYIGGCCGNSSHIQDKINDWFRDGGDIQISDIAEVAEGMIHHDGDDVSPFAKLEMDSLYQMVAKTLELREECAGKEDVCFDPWSVIALMWHLVKDHYVPARPGATTNLKYSSTDIALRTVERWGWAYSITRLGRRDDEPDSQWLAGDAVALSKMWPAVEHLYKTFETLGFEPFDAWAVVTKKREGTLHERLATNSLGYCVYRDRSEIDKLLDLWREDHKSREEPGHMQPVDELFEVVRVRVSPDKGVELLEGV